MSERKRRPKMKTRRPSVAPVLPKKRRPPFTTRATRTFSGKPEGRSRKLSLMLAEDKAIQEARRKALEEAKKKRD